MTARKVAIEKEPPFPWMIKTLAEKVKWAKQHIEICLTIAARGSGYINDYDIHQGKPVEVYEEAVRYAEWLVLASLRWRAEDIVAKENGSTDPPDLPSARRVGDAIGILRHVILDRTRYNARHAALDAIDDRMKTIAPEKSPSKPALRVIKGGVE